MEKIFVGKVVNTHGIKGEIRILSDFEKKNRVFVVGNELIIGNQPYKINTYRIHKNFDMVTLDGFSDINQVISFKGLKVYVDRTSLNLLNNEYLLEDLIDCNIILDDNNLGVVTDYQRGKNPLLMVSYNEKKYYIPLQKEYVLNIDVVTKNIIVNSRVEELML